ncbi:MAG TPA: GerMN domain-containing protein [Bacilli bacterium]|nr:GerMN domain-containing protein [Bacilli bacterium]
MIKKIITKKIIITTIALFALGLFCLLSGDGRNELKNINQELEYISKEVETHDIFLLDSNNYLALTQVIVDNEDKVKLAYELANILIKDGSGESRIPNGFKSVISSNTVINSITLTDDVMKIDLTKDFLETTKEMEDKVIESIIYTLTSIEGVNKVIIFSDGQILTKLPLNGKILPTTFDRTYGINKKYNINSIQDVVGITVYYINEHNNNYYYVPVTSYLNDSRDRISIIVDELSNNFTYMNDLMSFLNENVKLEKYEIKEDKMILEFNDAIFNSISEKDILEEVVYTITLSIKDNYQVKQVSFQVENEEILTKTIE